MFFSPKYRSGINKRDSGLQNEGGYGDSNFVRFKASPTGDALPQPIGGWSLKVLDPFDGKARGNHAWKTLEGKPVYAFGTSSKLYGLIGGVLKDITPPLHETVLHDVFTAKPGASVVTVNMPIHRLSDGQVVTFSHHLDPTTPSFVVEGSFPVTVVTDDTFTIDISPATAPGYTTPSGGYVDFFVPLPPGYADTPVVGYGGGPYGAGAYSVSPEQVTEATVWSLDNWGEYLMANLSGFGLFEWEPEAIYEELAYNGTFTGSADGWALGTGFTYVSNSVTGQGNINSNLSQNFKGIAEGGRTYRFTATFNVSAGSIKFQVNAGTTPALIDVAEASSPISKTGTYSRVFICPSDPTDFVFNKDELFVGSIDNVSFKLESKAYRLTTAPPRMDAMFVDPRGIVVALGTTLVTGAYSPTAVRTSDLGNNRAWVPDIDSMASEFTLRGGGGRLMAGLATSEQNLAWGDDGVFSFQYQAIVGNAYDIHLLGTKCGLISRHGMAEQNGFVAWMSNTKQFFIFRGVSSNALGKPEVIECPIQEDVFDNIDIFQTMKCHAGVNPAFTEVWFFYPDGRDGNECSRAAAVDWTTGTWVTHQMPRTSWQSSGIFQNPIALTPDGRIYEQEVSHTANGALIDAWIESGDMDTGEGDTLFIFKGIVPDFKDQVGNITFGIYGKNYPNGTLRLLGEHVSTPTISRLNFRYKCRQFRVRMTWSTTGGWGRIGAIRYDFAQTGAAK